MWGSYVALCDLGEPPDAYQCFGNTPKVHNIMSLDDAVFINTYFGYNEHRQIDCYLCQPQIHAKQFSGLPVTFFLHHQSLGSVPRCPPREWMDCMSSAGLESKFIFPQHKEKSYR